MKLIKNILKNNEFKDLNDYCEALKSDTSHITYKIKQVMNFFIEDLYRGQEDEYVYNIEKLSQKIEKVKKDNFEKNKITLSIMELMPPSFFDVDIILDNKIDFNTLSSGEKQKIYSINSILYHLNNLNSVNSNAVQYKYRYINIILDEIELYFHPELQRTYLNDLLQAISKVDTSYILGLNICFVTHSPFILSDMPDTKILFLEKDSHNILAKTIASKEKIKTFGSNIHELLTNGFFMEHSIGEFALSKIKEIVDFHYNVMQKVSDKKSLTKFQKKYKNIKEQFHFIQKHIGEEYIQGILKNHIDDIEKRLQKNNFKKQRIQELKDELKQLEG